MSKNISPNIKLDMSFIGRRTINHPCGCKAYVKKTKVLGVKSTEFQFIPNEKCRKHNKRSQ